MQAGPSALCWIYVVCATTSSLFAEVLRMILTPEQRWQKQLCPALLRSSGSTAEDGSWGWASLTATWACRGHKSSHDAKLLLFLYIFKTTHFPALKDSEDHPSSCLTCLSLTNDMIKKKIRDMFLLDNSFLNRQIKLEIEATLYFAYTEARPLSRLWGQSESSRSKCQPGSMLNVGWEPWERKGKFSFKAVFTR